MPLTLLQIPILALFLDCVERNTGMPALPEPETKQEEIPKGVVLNPDGTPYANLYFPNLYNNHKHKSNPSSDVEAAPPSPPGAN
ncbi:hypothetical protein E2P81_ATG12100 [Venturia nashicola]|nr:hypothetical protein E2P81_ATG12100 [Venturia nashicola]